MVTISASIDRKGELITVTSTLPGDHTNDVEIRQFLRAMTDVWYAVRHENSRLNETTTPGVATA